MTLMVPERETSRARLVRTPRTRKVAPPVHVSYWRRALRWITAPRRAYTALVLASMSVLVAGIALIYVPLALIVAGLAGGSLGLVGLGINVRGTR